MAKTEFLELLRPVRKKWLAPEARFQISISYQTGVQPTERTVEVSDAFGLGLDVTREFIIYDDLTLEIGPRDIVYITGDSGSGKSVLLRWLEQALKRARPGKQLLSAGENLLRQSCSETLS